MAYTPPQKILENYAKVLIDFALGGGTGIKKGEVVQVAGSVSATPLYVEVCKAVWRSGGHVLQNYQLDDNNAQFNLSKDFFDAASDEQLNFFPKNYTQGLVQDLDHTVALISEADKHALEKVDPKKMMQRGQAMKPYRDLRNEKESANKFTWTLALYGTPAMAAEAKLSEEDYWQQIIDACFLDEDDPIAKWREVFAGIENYKQKLNDLSIEKVHVEAEDVDLWVTIGEKRAWEGGGGRNIPSFEIFTSPDWRGTEGWIEFNQPLYRYGNLVTGIRLEFKEGRVVSATAKENEAVLKEMIATEGADKVGEFSLTDKRFSRITKFMAETLFDENVGGPFGNTHIAVGMSYHNCYDGDESAVSKEEWERLGYNDSSVHTDMFSTTDRTVTATLKDGSTKVIYKDGQFQL